MSKKRVTGQRTHLVFQRNLLSSWHTSRENLCLQTLKPGEKRGLTEVWWDRSDSRELAASLQRIATSAEFEEEIFPQIVMALNHHHRLSADSRFWTIITGHWFRKVVRSTTRKMDRLGDLQLSDRAFSVTSLRTKSSDLAPLTTAHFFTALTDAEWHHAIFENLLRFVGPSVQEVRQSESGVAELFQLPALNAPAGGIYPAAELDADRDRRRQRVGLVFRLLDRLNPKRGVAISTYLSSKSNFGLFLRLWGDISVFREPETVFVEADSGLRTSLAEGFAVRSWSAATLAIWNICWLVMPRVYLEGFSALSSCVVASGHPAKPKFILTAGHFDGKSDAFNVFTAKKTQAGAKYVVCQHGNDYGTNAIDERTVEETVSDIFVSWGWEREPGEVAPLGWDFRVLSGDPGPKAKEILFVLDSPERGSSVLDPDFIAGIRFNLLRDVLDSIPPTTLAQSTFRFHHQWNVDLRWPGQLAAYRNIAPDSAFDLHTAPMNTLIARHRLVVFNYDSTGFYECLARGIPTIALMAEGFSFLTPNAVPLYRRLKDQQIIHHDSVSASRALARIMPDPQNWWCAGARQHAISAFTANFAKQNNHLVRDLATILKSKPI